MQQVDYMHIDQVGIRSVAFSPDGTLLAGGGDDARLRLWDARTGKELRAELHGFDIGVPVFSPDGKRIISGSDDGALKRWEANRPEGP
jgi:WD40 repeat protein